MALFKDVYNFQCKIFEPATADLSKNELKVLLKQHYEYFPHTIDSAGNKQPYDASNDYSKQWFQAYNHLLMLLEMRKQEAKHNISLTISILALLVSVAGVVIKLFTS